MNDSESVIDEYFEGVLSRNPHIATILGDHRFDGDVPKGTYSSVLDEIDHAKNVRSEIDEPSTFTEKVIASSLDYDIYEMEELRIWERTPQAMDSVIALIYPLYTRRFSSLDNRLSLIAERMEKIPRYIDELKERTRNPVELWARQEIAEIKEAPSMLQIIADEAGELERQDVAYRINSASEEIIEALKVYSDYLADLDKDGEWRLGKSSFDELLSLRRLPSSDEIKKLAKDAESEAREDINTALSEMDVDTVDEAINQIGMKHPSGIDELIEAYRDEAEKARSYVQREEIATVPQGDEFMVAQTPEHLSALIPRTGYIEPAPLNPDEKAMYYVTNPMTEQEMKEHNRAEIKGVAAADFYPGAHNQRIHEINHASKEILLAGRFNAFGDDFVSGWELYSMDIMIQNGIDDPEFKLVKARNLLQAASAAVIDVELHTDETTIRDAIDYLRDNAGFEERGLFERVIEFTKNPGEQLSQFIGYHLLRETREEFIENGDRTQRELHDTLLKQGGLPVGLHREALRKNPP